MKKLTYYLLFFILIASCKQNNNLQLTLPSRIYCSQVSPISMYYENLIQTANPGDYTFKVTPELGSGDSVKYTFYIREKESRNFKMNVEVFDKLGKKVDGGTTLVCYTVPKTVITDTINVLITGNSLAAAGIFPSKVKSFFHDELQFPVNFLGTKKSSGGVHEGYGGWTWKKFSQNIESPFVFNILGSDTTLSFKNYFEDVVKAEPDFVIIELGINDCFRADTTSIETIDSTIDAMFKHAEFYLTELIEYKNDIQIGICLPPSANTNNTGFIASYGDKYKQTGWTKIQRRIVQKSIKYFDNNFQANCSLIPLEVNFDAYNGYPVDNGVHPNKYGYHQIASSISNWLLYKIYQN